jgi:IS30 family transposase
MQRKHLTKEERFCIEKLIKQGLGYRQISQTLDRGLGTICDEVNRNGGRETYKAKKAHHRAYLRQYRKKRNCNKVAMHPFVRKYVEAKLPRYWSPERISGRLKLEHNLVCSPKSIRKYIKSRGGLERFLFWNRTRKKPGRKRGTTQYLVDQRKFIEQRPVPSGLGHWEGDFIVSRHNTSVLLVLNDKVSRFTKIKKLSQRKNTLVNQSVNTLLRDSAKKTLTLDNDIAFQAWKQMNIPVYFTHPYCSWEKGLVENTNRWIRSFLPKKTDLRSVPEEMIQSIEHWLNHTPRQCLGFRTPHEVHWGD